MKKLTNILILIVIILIVHVIASKIKGQDPFAMFKKEKITTIENQEVVPMTNSKIGAVIKTTRGDININFFPNAAPITVTNMVTLAKNGYYDGIKFHRVIADFMIQGGDPTGTGAGGPGYNFQDEFNNGHSFSKAGILAMANAGPRTNGSQFFITHTETSWLNNKHTIFGEVVFPEDQKVVDSIKQGDVINTIEITGDATELLKNNAEFVAKIEKAIKK